jgi:stage V sporulation protein R
MTTRTKPLTGELLRLKDEIHQYALDYGLDFYPVIFEVCDYDTINIVAAQGGFPSRYPHWRFGMEYDQLSKSYAYGLQKIYELVINTNPCYAYLLNANHLVDQKIVMAHVYGHADFFKNNLWFASTDRSMMDVMANHGTKIRRYMEKYGQDTVEAFVDRVLSLE